MILELKSYFEIQTIFRPRYKDTYDITPTLAAQQNPFIKSVTEKERERKDLQRSLPSTQRNKYKDKLRHL